jgi:hypothetical protein
MGYLRFFFSLVFGGVMSWLRSIQAFYRGRREGEERAKAKASEDAAEAARQAKEVRNEVEALPHDELRNRASRWVRGSKREDHEPKA